MKITPAAHIHKMSGASGELVYVHLKNGTCYARQRPCRRHNRRTEEQILMQNYTGRASANWINLTDSQRSGWETYAKQYMHKDRKGNPVTPNAIAMYVRANMTRQILDLPLLTAPPTEAAPGPIMSMVEVPVSEPRMVGLRVTHKWSEDADLSDLVLLARMAPPPVTDARRFQAFDFRYICKAAPASAQPLPVSGGNVFFSQIQFDVPPGKRYMIELRVARLSDGIVSTPTQAEFRKPL